MFTKYMCNETLRFVMYFSSRKKLARSSSEIQHVQDMIPDIYN